MEPTLFDVTPKRSRALDGLSDETIAAIEADATPEMVRAFVACLSTEATTHADTVRRALEDEPWFPRHTRADTQRRFLRRLRDAAILAGHPVCSLNTGFKLGNKADVLEAAARARNLAQGALARADRLTQIAYDMEW